MNYAGIADAGAIVDDYARMDDGPGADGNIVADTCARVDTDTVTQRHIRADARLGQHTQWRVRYRIEKCQQFGKSQVRIGNFDDRATDNVSPPGAIKTAPAPVSATLAAYFGLARKVILSGPALSSGASPLIGDLPVSSYDPAQIVGQFCNSSGWLHGLLLPVYVK